MKLTKYFILVVVVFLGQGCSDFLDVRPKMNLVIPQSLEDLQAIMDDYNNRVSDPTYGEISADDYYLTDDGWNTVSEEGHRRAYLWMENHLFGPATDTEWLNVYRNVYAANTVMEKLEVLKPDPRFDQQRNDVEGQAYFLRARSFLSVANIWALGYNAQTATETLGIPLRMSSDFNTASTRSTLEETYAVITDDLKKAVSLLPAISIHPSRPSKAAALALQARTYLFMRDYERCWSAADACLKLRNELLDFNTLNAAATYPVPEFNKEIIYVSRIGTPEPIRATRARIDSVLYKSYLPHDLRRKIFFQSSGGGAYSFKGSYMGNITLFSGLSTAEAYLMRAECSARKGDLASALQDLNTLLKSRWDNKVDYDLVVIQDPEILLQKILLERRKELLMRGIRWPDLKRLNIEGRNITLKRFINNQVIELPPNDLRYALPIPDPVIELSGMPQNPR